MESTKNYEQFKLIKGNRERVVAHVNKLKKAIEDRNLLHINPIIVDDEMRVVDGQHRLEAAKELGVPVYYLVLERASLRDVQVLNANNKKWGLADYLNSYCETGKADYIEVRDAAEKYDLPLGITIGLFSGTVKGRKISADEERTLSVNFKNGDFIITHRDFAYDTMEKLKNLSHYTGSNVWKKRYFLYAVLETVSAIGFEKMIEMLEQYPHKIHLRATPKDYLREFEDIYQYVYKKRIRL